VIGQLDRIAAQRPDSSSFYAPARRIEGKDPAFAKALLAIVRESVLPAFRRYRDVLSVGYLPRSRPEAGIRWLPNGVACYRALPTMVDAKADAPLPGAGHGAMTLAIAARGVSHWSGWLAAA
jgi:uncharacterized protein (DUF885 family)